MTVILHPSSDISGSEYDRTAISAFFTKILMSTGNRHIIKEKTISNYFKLCQDVINSSLFNI